MRELAKTELDQVSGGKITTFQENPGGNRLPAGSNSQGQAIDTVSENPAGKQPPGQQP